MPPSEERKAETTESSNPPSADGDGLESPLGICAVAVPHASVMRAVYCMAERRRCRKSRKSRPVKTVLSCERSWKVTGSTSFRMKKTMLLLTK